MAKLLNRLSAHYNCATAHEMRNIPNAKSLNMMPGYYLRCDPIRKRSLVWDRAERTVLRILTMSVMMIVMMIVMDALLTGVHRDIRIVTGFAKVYS